MAKPPGGSGRSRCCARWMLTPIADAVRSCASLLPSTDGRKPCRLDYIHQHRMPVPDTWPGFRTFTEKIFCVIFGPFWTTSKDASNRRTFSGHTGAPTVGMGRTAIVVKRDSICSFLALMGISISVGSLVPAIQDHHHCHCGLAGLFAEFCRILRIFSQITATRQRIGVFRHKASHALQPHR